MIPPILLVGVGLIPVLAMGEFEVWIRFAGWVGIAAGLFLLALIWFQLRLPRLAYANGQLWVYLAGSGPLRVPIEIVQCFFLGSGAGQIPGSKGRRIGVRNITMRLDEKATDYHHRSVKPALGRWDKGYIVIHGAWCEPLDLAVVGRLNAVRTKSRQQLTGQIAGPWSRFSIRLGALSLNSTTPNRCGVKNLPHTEKNA
jgi:hypothetical protein